MRRLQYTLNLVHLRGIKKDIVPAIFTLHQFELIEKRFSNKKMTPSEKNEFSRAVSKKMVAINKILEKETDNLFCYGKEKILKDRLELASRYLKRFSRMFKNKHVLITGSFLFSEKYHDIDIFVVAKYEKEDYRYGKFHINYMGEEAYTSSFFASISGICVSNRQIIPCLIKKAITLDTFISLYQELFNDLHSNFAGVKKTLREFLVQSAFISKMPLPDSYMLWHQVRIILRSKSKAKIIKKIFVYAVILGIDDKKALSAMKDMVRLYKGMMEDYSQHKAYYLNLIKGFQEVIEVES